MNCLKVSIHSPGLGRKERRDGFILRIKYGKAKPSPRLKKIKIEFTLGCNKAKPIAEPIKGAVHGEATITAKIPVKKDSKDSFLT